MDKKSAIKIFAAKFLDNADSQLTETLCGIAGVVDVDAKGMIFMDGEPAHSIYFLLSGGVKVSKISQDGKETVIHFIGENELFALRMLFGSGIYHVNASAFMKSTLLAFDIVGFKKLCAENSDFVMRLFVSLTSKLEYLVNMIDSLTKEDATQRLTKYLNAVAQESGSNAFRLPVAKGELALMLGITPETLSRLFTKLEKDGAIKRKGRNIEILRLVDEPIKKNM